MFKFMHKWISVAKLDLLNISRRVLYIAPPTRGLDSNDGNNKTGKDFGPSSTSTTTDQNGLKTDEALDTSNQQEFQLNEEDLLENFIRGSGPGGQSVNTSSNCVQLKHVPSGIVIKCHKSRSLMENRKLARALMFEKLEHLFRGEESKIGKELKKRKKRSTEQKRRQRLREQAKLQHLIFKTENSKDSEND